MFIARRVKAHLGQLIVAVLAGMGPSIAVCAQTVSVGLPSEHDPFSTPFYIAELKGFFGELKIDYRILKGGIEVLKQVSNGSIDIGFAQPTEVLIRYAAKHKEAPPVRYWYMLETTAVDQIAVPVGSPIKSIEDLKGKIIGITSQTASNVSRFKGILKLRGLDPDNDVTWRAVGPSVQHFQALRTGAIDASATNSTRQAGFDFNGAKLRVLKDPISQNLFGNAFFSSPSALQSSAKVVILEKVADGISKAVTFCDERRDECLDILLTRFPEFLPSNLPAENARRYMANQLEVRMMSLRLIQAQRGIPGYFPDSAWKDYVDFMRVSENLPDNVSTMALYTNDIVTHSYQRGIAR